MKRPSDDDMTNVNCQDEARRIKALRRSTPAPSTTEARAMKQARRGDERRN
ncbi:hypothetical protein [Krasilnikovia sp. MM14-A1259]|uniref:hypothetical protein n=1 Tax=Krasilnikovia sp. MM14-A1259 TaxID=3373539 RepID=UPI003805C223